MNTGTGLLTGAAPAAEPTPVVSIADIRGEKCGSASPPQLCDGVICYAGVDWWYHNRGHSECQIMTRLVRRLPVIWVNSIGMRLPKPGKTQLALRRYARKLKSTLHGLRRDPSGMWIYSPVFIPRYTRRALNFNGSLLNYQLKLVCKRVGIRRPSAWITVPTAGPAVMKKDWISLVFNRSDDFSAFPEADSGLIQSLEQEIIQRADHVLYVSQLLYKRERGADLKAHYLGHGVDFEHFARVSPTGRRPAPPDSISRLPRPLVGFYGAFDEYTIDLNLLVKVARSIAPGTLLLIGPTAMNIDRLLAEPNVTWLGPIPYAELPDYAIQFDLGLMPWLQNDWIHACNPIKLKEYLAIGFPIVSMKFPHLKEYENLVYAAGNHDEFLDQVQVALAEHDPRMIRARRESLHDCTWDTLTERVAKLLKVHASKKE